MASCNLNTHYNGKLIDILARRSLKTSGLDYKHGTGHGVGFFLMFMKVLKEYQNLIQLRLKKV